MNLEGMTLNEISQSQRTNTAGFHLQKVSTVVKSYREQGGGCQEWRGGGDWELLNGCNFHFTRWKDSGDWVHYTVNVLNTTELHVANG